MINWHRIIHRLHPFIKLGFIWKYRELFQEQWYYLLIKLEFLNIIWKEMIDPGNERKICFKLSNQIFSPSSSTRKHYTQTYVMPYTKLLHGTQRKYKYSLLFW